MFFVNTEENNEKISLAALSTPDYKAIWPNIDAAWKDSFQIRNEKTNQNNDGGLWQFKTLPCLASDRAPTLVKCFINKTVFYH